MVIIVCNVPIFVFRDISNSYARKIRDISNSYAKKNHLLYSKLSIDDKRKKCFGIVTRPCFLSTVPAVPSHHSNSKPLAKKALAHMTSRHEIRLVGVPAVEFTLCMVSTGREEVMPQPSM
jgi:hypothetical protein